MLKNEGEEMANAELWAYLNGKMVRESEAVIPLTDRGV